jgi:hypothetical protein
VTEAEQLRQQHAEAMEIVEDCHARYIAAPCHVSWRWEALAAAAHRASEIELRLLRMEAPNV